MSLSTIHTELDYDLAAAYIDLGRARLHAQAKDTPGNRQALADAYAAIDRILDMYLDADRMVTP